ANRTRKLKLLEITTKLGNLIGKAQASLAIRRLHGSGLTGTNNPQAGGKIGQTAQQCGGYVHSCDELRRVTGAKQLSSQRGGSQGRIQGNLFFQLFADRKLGGYLPQDIFNRPQPALEGLR